MLPRKPQTLVNTLVHERPVQSHLKAGREIASQPESVAGPESGPIDRQRTLTVVCGKGLSDSPKNIFAIVRRRQRGRG